MSLMDYNGNKSTSLIARDLLTSDEVKQLHYKTIIFPIIGYPIFRDTVMYNKFPCYEEGEIDRKVQSLKQLDSTYFTVEQINFDYETDLDFFENSKENQNFYKKSNESEKEIFNTIIEKLNEVFKDITYEVEFLRKNDTAYVQVTINREKTNEIWLKVNSCIDQEYFHIEDLSKADKTIFNIHVKGLTEMLSLLNKNL